MQPDNRKWVICLRKGVFGTGRKGACDALSSSYVSLCAETCTINSEEEAVEAELQSILTGISAFSSLM